ncbi:bifunctional glycosyltransferase/CDP-glycerol:glycerophosphate glycerophosphotransferase [Jidongwangia harbinensis]|uniref:bifunctional glycosyltransferase/CDP-glycerol:glycerophosphate glycerophosphotransferase n=1 Tax=Jidongwangia harbinensis TaxID=2878561 RepID=UPI001CD97346|nr:bifunctional glycosyltransferase family 2 protein/CDP-glycerol:glycerophosphate glycerophosphotransferase [Jidongwangia harbinensis]MCA2213893.1 bifunctional glycosyltransferase family 2 protein/CDP-glycerol:glycerophosphate glycerophosphotransferase [Jidongwangia harbinensis]
MSAVLSIVVPIYNVAPYLDECLSSIAGQTRAELDVVMVDDGSTDDSAAIAARFAEKDSRFTLVRKANAGLGAARNTGLEHVTGDYLMFVDSDDSLAPYAAELLVGSIEQTGSDFSCGNVLRYTTKGMTGSPMHKGAFGTTKLRTHVRKRPALLADRTAWNKVYRRSFWDAHGFRFPEGVLYEDIPVTIPAHVLAESVDVLSVPVYYWRQREGEDRSITQRRGEIPAFIDRLDNCWGVSRMLGERGEDRIKRLYDASVLKSDLMLFVRVLPDVDDDYRKVFLEKTNEYLDTIDPGIIGELDANLRVLWSLIRHRMLPELLKLIPTVHKPRRIARRGLRRYHDMDLFRANLPQLPPELFLAGTPSPRTKVHEVSWTDGRLRIRGHAFIPGQSAAKPWSTSRLIWLTGKGGTRTKRTPLVSRRCIDATGDHGTPKTTYDWSGFEAVIDPDSLRAADGAWRDGVWTVAVGVVGVSRWSQGPLEMGQPANPIRFTSRYADGVRITPFVDGGNLRVRVERSPVRITGGRLVEIDGERHVEIEGENAPAAAPLTAQLSRAEGLPWGSYPVDQDGGRFRFRIPAGELQRDGVTYPPLRVNEPADRWSVDLVGGTGDKPRRIRVTVADDLAWTPLELGVRTVHLHATPDRYPRLVALPPCPTVTEVTSAARAYRFAGRIPPGSGDWSRLALVLRLGSGRELRTFPARVEGDAWSVEIDPDAVPNFGGHIRLRSGTWHVLCRNGREPIRALPAAPAVLAATPLPLAGDAPRVTCEWHSDERLVLRVRSAIAETERGKGNAARLRAEHYLPRREEPLRDAVFYNSFTGRQYSDNPRAVHEELVSRGLPLEHLWLSTEGQAPVPPTAEAVPLWSRRWYDALATSRYIVTNQHLPAWFRRRAGQVVVQTWHGTPLKRIGFDIADVKFTDQSYLAKLAQEAPNWTYLVSPNRFSTPILRRAFGYTGEMLEIGYPRNDILFRDRAEVDARIRATIGVPQDKKIILYAPTWRDDQYSDGGYRIPVHLDVADAAARLGTDHVLLVRRHPNVIDEIPGEGDGFVYDVSTYPDMADLLAVTDVLVTDYSSVMFDFANTGRPMLFFTYDLAHYRDELRGFYFDFEAEAPGPLLSTSEEVITAIHDVETVSREYRERYAAFAAKACDLDDGRAAAALADHMLEAGKR